MGLFYILTDFMRKTKERTEQQKFRVVKEKLINLRIGTDAEFYTQILPAINPKSYADYKKVICNFEPVTVQICNYGSKNVTVYEHPLLGYGIIPSFHTDFALLDFFGFEQVAPPIDGCNEITFEVSMYYSPLDILCLFKTKELMMMIDAQIESGRVLRAKDKSGVIKTGIYFKIEDYIFHVCIKICDLKGFTPAGVSGLEGTAKSWGVSFTGKEYKKYFDITDVRKAYKNLGEFACDLDTKRVYSQHDYFIMYAKDDVPVLWETKDSVLLKMQALAVRLGLSPIFKPFNTIGNMTNQIGIKCLLKQLNLNDDKEGSYHLASYLYPSSANAICDEGWSTAKYLASVDGGYCKHKRTSDVLIKDLISDMDLKSAYASAMEVMPYGIGIPAIVSFPENREKPLWKSLHKSITENLIDNLWVARISTTKNLSFDQDLIYSKIFGIYDFEESYEDLISDDEVSSEDSNDLKIPVGHFQLLRRQITNGVFTSDIKEVIDNYWKPSERREFYNNIELVSLIYYPKNCEVINLEEFKNIFELDGKIEFKFSKKGVEYKDTRGVYWYRCTMGEGWITATKKERDEQKKIKQTIKDKSSEEYVACDAIQNALKNVNNSTYGVTGSQFYQTEKPTKKEWINKDGEHMTSLYGNPKIGNVVAAQNITAKVRVAAWCMSKSLNCHQLITDGGAYCPNKVWYWNWENEKTRHYFGSQELYNLCQGNCGNDVDKGRLNTSLQPLGGKEWKLINWEYNSTNSSGLHIKSKITNGEIIIDGGLENWGVLDKIAYEKCRVNFTKLSCIHQITFESKQLYKGALFQSQANYLFEMFNGQFVIKSRGYNLRGQCYTTPHLSKDSKVNTHPYETLMINTYQNGKANPEIITHFQQLLLSANEKNKSEDITKNYESRGLLSGCPTVKSTTPELISLSGFNWLNREQFEDWNKLCEQIKRKTGYKTSSKFVIANGKYVKETSMIINGSYNYVDACKEMQRAIDNEVKPNVFYNKFVSEFVTGKNVLLHPQKRLEINFTSSNGN